MPNITSKNKITLHDIELLTRRDVSNLLKIGISSVDAIPEGDLPRVHLGKSIRFTLESIHAYINKHESKGGR
jgi:predicted DNA-binding transcriptional regulator AlpA